MMINEEIECWMRNVAVGSPRLIAVLLTPNFNLALALHVDLKEVQQGGQQQWQVLLLLFWQAGGDTVLRLSFTLSESLAIASTNS